MEGGAVIVDEWCRARTHIRDGHRDDGVDRMSAVLRGRLAPIRRMIEVQEGEVVLLKRFAHSSYRIKAINSLTAHLVEELRAHFGEAWISGYQVQAWAITCKVPSRRTHLHGDPVGFESGQLGTIGTRP